MTVVYDWRAGLKFETQVFVPGGAARSGGTTSRGAVVRSPEPGGRGVVDLTFNINGGEGGRDVSWTMGIARQSRVFRIPLYATAQLVSPASIGGTVGGLMWSNGQPWSSGSPWDYRPAAPVASAALEGETTVTVDLSAYGEVIYIGHVIGFSYSDGHESAHMVQLIEYDGTTATMTIDPPLRRDVTTDDSLQFRPKMTVTCVNPDGLVAAFQPAGLVKMGGARFIEALI